MKNKLILLAAIFGFSTLFLRSESAAAPVSDQGIFSSVNELPGGGENKKKNEKKASKPSKLAKRSAKTAIAEAKHKEGMIMGRASVRNFFHKMFNTSPGKEVNFRSHRSRRKWKKRR